MWATQDVVPSLRYLPLRATPEEDFPYVTSREGFNNRGRGPKCHQEREWGQLSASSSSKLEPVSSSVQWPQFTAKSRRESLAKLMRELGSWPLRGESLSKGKENKQPEQLSINRTNWNWGEELWSFFSCKTDRGYAKQSFMPDIKGLKNLGYH